MPREHETERVERFSLRDGREVCIRRIRPEDAERLIEFGGRVSREALRRRFFTPMRRLDPRFALHLADTDFVARGAFVVTFPEDEAIQAVGRFEQDDERPASAEVAFLVADDLQGQWLGTELLFHLAYFARGLGYTRFTALVLIENSEMMEVFRNAGYPLNSELRGDTIHVELDISSPAVRAATVPESGGAQAGQG